MKSPSKTVKVYAPASIGNVCAGFDVLGVAIDAPGDIVIAKRTQAPGLTFTVKQTTSIVPTNNQNIAAHVAQLILDECHPSFGIDLTLYKNMPIGSGLGSSGASSAAAAVAANALLTKPLPKQALLAFTVEGERLASGTAHADNVAPSLLGGLCLIQHYQPLNVIKVPIKNIFYWVVVHPHIIIETKMARGLLPTSLPTATTTEQFGYLGGLIVGLMKGDAKLVSQSLHDTIAEPTRSTLIPEFNTIKAAAIHAGALGFSISGSGPSVFALTDSLKTAQQVALTIKQTFLHAAKINSDTYISKINQRGTHILETSV